MDTIQGAGQEDTLKNGSGFFTCCPGSPLARGKQPSVLRLEGARVSSTNPHLGKGGGGVGDSIWPSIETSSHWLSTKPEGRL